MSDPTVAEAIAEMQALAGRMRAEAEVMRRATRRQSRVLVLVGLFFVGYISWAFLRVAKFVDAEALAGTTSENAMSRASTFVDESTFQARMRAPDIVRGAEALFVAEVPSIRKSVDLSYSEKLGGALQAALTPFDRALIEEIAQLPDGPKRAAAAAGNPAEVAALYAAVQEKARARPEVLTAASTIPPGLEDLRDHVRQLRASLGLTTTERAERELLQMTISPTAPKP